MRRTVIMSLVLAALAAPVVHGSTANAETATARRVSAWLPYWDSRAIDDFIAHRELYDEVLPFWYEMRSATSIVAYEGAGSARLLDAARSGGVAVVPTINNDFDPERLRIMLATDASIAAHVSALTDLAAPFNGIDVDYESGRAEDRARFTTFVQRLAVSLHAAGKTLSVTVHPKTSEPGTWDGPQSQDWSAIGAVADRVRVMAYDYHWSTSSAGPVAPLSWVDAVSRFAASRITPSKVRLGMPLYGYDWVGSSGEGLMWDQIERRRLAAGLALQRSSDGAEPWFRYTSSGQQHEVWYADSVSTAAKLDVVDRYALGGATFWRLGGEDPAIWPLLGERWGSGSTPIVAPTDTTPPTVVTGLLATPAWKGVALTWNSVADPGPIRYQVWRATTEAGAGIRIADVSSTSLRDTGLRRNRTYWYVVRAVDAAGNLGPFSARVSARTT